MVPGCFLPANLAKQGMILNVRPDREIQHTSKALSVFSRAYTHTRTDTLTLSLFLQARSLFPFCILGAITFPDVVSAHTPAVLARPPSLRILLLLLPLPDSELRADFSKDSFSPRNWANLNEGKGKKEGERERDKKVVSILDAKGTFGR